MNQKMLEIVALSTNTLAELRDKLYCLYDEVGEPGIRFQSSMFYINDHFYDDTREGTPRPDDPAYGEIAHPDDCQLLVCNHPRHVPVRVRYSDTILQWMAAEGVANSFREKFRQGLVQVSSMETTNIANITCQIGTPYLFMHQGSCQHLLVVTDIRMPSSVDVDCRKMYPLIVFQGKLRRRKCFLCDTYTAAHVTYDDIHAPCEPCFWCEQCFKRMHFDETGTQTYQGWKAYPYHHE